jgi:hypothetical protein
MHWSQIMPLNRSFARSCSTIALMTAAFVSPAPGAPDAASLWKAAFQANQAPLPDGADAWPLIRKAVDQYQFGLSTVRLTAPDGTPTAPILDVTTFVLPPPQGDGTTALLQSTIEASVRGLEQSGLGKAIDEAAAAPRCEQPPSDGWIGAFIAAGMRQGDDKNYTALCAFETLRFVLASRVGESDVALARFRSAARLTWYLEQGPIARRLLASSCLDGLMLALREEIAARRIAPKQAQAYLSALDTARPATPWALTTALEEVRMNELVRGIVAKSGTMSEKAFGRAIEGCDLQDRDDIAAIVTEAVKVERIDPTAQTLIRALHAYAPLDRAERRAMSAFVDPRLLGDAFPCEPYSVARFLSSSWTWVDAWLDELDADRTRLEGTRLMLAIEAYRASAGHPPATLAELVPTHLAVLPKDPVSGQPFGYRALPPAEAEKDVFRRSYLLWSAGADGKDDGGVEPHEPENLSRVLGGGSAPPPTGDWVVNTPSRP